MVPYWPLEEENPNIAALRNIFPGEPIGDGATQLISSITLLFTILAIATIVN